MRLVLPKRNGVLKIVLLLMSFVLLISACQKIEKPTALKEKAEIKFPLTVIDDSNRKVEVKKKPKRIISLSPSNTEILFALGLENEIVGVTTYCDYPAAAKKKEKIGSFAQPNIEKIIALKPDLVLGTGGIQDPVVKELEKLKITVFVANPKNLDGVLKNILTISRITGKQKDAQIVIETMKSVRDKVARTVAKLKDSQKPKVFFDLYNEPLTTVGKDTFHNELITIAGGKNIAGNLKEKYPQFSLDTLIQENPDVYIAIKDSMYNPGNVNERPSYTDIAAVKNNRVTIIDGDLVNRPGPRITKGLWEIAKAIHPELFK
jgi:iron complex transport system substrate-binding protein